MRCFRFLAGKSHKTLTGFPMFTPAVTDAEKLARYEELIEMMQRMIASEKAKLLEGRDHEFIKLLRSETYGTLVNIAFGHRTLPDLPFPWNGPELYLEAEVPAV